MDLPPVVWKLNPQDYLIHKLYINRLVTVKIYFYDQIPDLLLFSYMKTVTLYNSPHSFHVIHMVAQNQNFASIKTDSPAAACQKTHFIFYPLIFLSWSLLRIRLNPIGLITSASACSIRTVGSLSNGSFARRSFLPLANFSNSIISENTGCKI